MNNNYYILFDKPQFNHIFHLHFRTRTFTNKSSRYIKNQNGSYQNQIYCLIRFYKNNCKPITIIHAVI